jgi:hypothetical protein
MPVVTNTNDSGDGSLRQAILCANITGGMDTVTFDIPGDGPHIIVLENPLPIVIDPVVIDGYSQSGAVPNTDPNGFNGILQIGIDGNNLDPGFSGLILSTGDCTVRGLAIGGFEGELSPDGENVFGGAGISISTGGCAVQGNFLGTDIAGTSAKPNAFGIAVTFNPSGLPNSIGGTAPDARNIISGNEFSGILLQENNEAGNIVQGNFIGVDLTGRRKLPNGENGVFILFDANNVVGGPEPGAGNVIGGNDLRGIGLVGEGTFNNLVRGNFIGTDFTRSLDLGNQIEGIIVFESENGNAMVGNSIAFNVDMGIDIEGDGPDVNDVPLASVPPDQDGGSNNRQNYPVITAVSSMAKTTTIQGMLESIPNTDFRIDFYGNTICDATGYGEGQFPLGFDMVTADANGLATFESVVDGLISTGDHLTSTATLIDATGNLSDTSEFSLCFEVTDGVEPTPTPTPGPGIECDHLDFDGNQVVDSRDLLQLIDAIDSGNLAFDLTGDNMVDQDDVFRFSQCWYELTGTR